MVVPKLALGITRQALIAFAIGFCGVVLSLALEVFTDTDIRLQDHFYNFETHQWLINPQASLPRFVFYTLPKLILYPVGALLLVSCFNVLVRTKLRLDRRESAYLFCCLAAIPLVAGTGKNLTHVHCPSELERYGGTEIYAKVITRNRPAFRKVPPHCFPAGHASGGFALFALYFLRRKAIWLAPGLGVGWIMGLYQMFKGAHFLSHTLTTMFLALALAAAFAPILQPQTRWVRAR
jgi:membrane-associated PAP2 superfamily phosphatase